MSVHDDDREKFMFQAKLPLPLFPALGLKILVLGKSFAGKSSVLKRYAEGNNLRELHSARRILNPCESILETGVTIVNIEQVFHEAIEAFNSNEMNDDDVSRSINTATRDATMSDFSLMTTTTTTIELKWTIR